jgi:hypothetical protein
LLVQVLGNGVKVYEYNSDFPFRRITLGNSMKGFVFAAILVITVSARAHQEDIRWSEGEHLELGENATKKVCAEMGLVASKCPAANPIPRRDQKLSFTYGEVVTSADYYHTPLDFYQDRLIGIRAVLVCAHRQKKVHRDQENSDDVKYPSCTAPGLIGMPTYLEVVTTNYNHFGWNNMKTYVKYHTLALQKAQQSFLKKTTSASESRALLNQALIYNAYADHYLTDAFASGHIRIPRVQIKNWAASRLPGFFKSLRGDLLTMLMHDRESISLRTNKEEGLLVENSLGDVWTTRGDSNLHLGSFPNDPVRELPTQALTESMRELLITWQTGEIPEGQFKAAFYVPFHKGIPLTEKFSARGQGMTQKQFMSAFYSNIPFFERFVFKQSDLERMLQALPSIFTVFQRDIRKDIETMSELRERLPPEYLEAYSKVQ